MKQPTTIAFTCALFARTSLALTPIVVQEQEFIVEATGDRFVIIGVDYQPGGQAAYGVSDSDPLSNGTLCLRDATLMQQLGVNTIRSYNVEPTLNHDECASIFDAAGIYMLIDVNSPLAGQSIDRTDPASSYDVGYLEHIFSVVEAFMGYPNTLGFFAGNEVINTVQTGQANPPYIRAVQRDLKTYIANHAARTIPVGYSAAQVEDVLQDTWAYLQCNNAANGSTNATDDLSRSDFFGLNSYSWCGNASSYTISGYNVLVQMFGNSTIPVFFSEYGCNDPLPREFDEVPVLYGPLMTSLSGGLVYEFTEEGNDFGLVQEYGNGSLQLLPDYDTLLARYATLNVTLIESRNGTATDLQPPACAADLISTDGFSTDFDIPAPPPGGAALISAGVSNISTGALVAVTQTVVTLPVFATDGAAITGLRLTSLLAANHPGQVGTATASTTSGTSASHGSAATTATTTTTTTKKAAAPRVGVDSVVGAVAAAAFGVGILAV